MADDIDEGALRQMAEAALAVEFGVTGDGVTIEAEGEPVESIESGGDEGEPVMTGAGLAYIERMIETGNRVMLNPYGEPIVELICPRPMVAEMYELIEEWDLNPSGHGVIAQEPSFAEDLPEVAEEVRSFQFLLTEGEEDDLRSCGYDLYSIFDELEDEMVMASKARRVGTSLPFES